MRPAGPTPNKYKFILSNGQQSVNQNKDSVYYKIMMPKDVPNKIKAVDIFSSDGHVCAFQFFDWQHKQLFKVG